MGYDETGAPLFALPKDRYAGAVAGDGFVGVASAGRDAELFLIEPSRAASTPSRPVRTPSSPTSEPGCRVAVAGESWLEKDGSDYWIAELP